MLSSLKIDIRSTVKVINVWGIIYFLSNTLLQIIYDIIIPKLFGAFYNTIYKQFILYLFPSKSNKGRYILNRIHWEIIIWSLGFSYFLFIINSITIIIKEIKFTELIT